MAAAEDVQTTPLLARRASDAVPAARSAAAAHYNPQGSSFFGAVANLANAAIGAGVLSLPFFFASTGVVIGVCILFVVASMSAFSLALLVDCNMLGQVCYYIFQSIVSLCSV